MLQCTLYEIIYELLFIHDSMASKVKSLSYVEAIQLCIYVCQPTDTIIE